MAKSKAEKNEINIEISEGLTVTFSGGPTDPDSFRPSEYTGKFLKKNNGGIIFGICADKKSGLKLKKGSTVTVSFVEQKSLYSFDARILGIRKAGGDENFEIEDDLSESGGIGKKDKYIAETVPLTAAEKHQRREFFRIPIKVDIYYKPIEAHEEANIANFDLRFEIGSGDNKERLKLTTSDISAGGFKCVTGKQFRPGELLNCMLIIGYEALPAVTQILKIKPDADNPDLYDVRAIFYKINDQVRDRVVRYIFSQQRQTLSKLSKRRF